MKKKKKEFSKVIMAIILIFGLANGAMYHVEILRGFQPDPALAVQSVVTIVGSFVSYVLYSFGLKNSRNKYGVDETGEPWKIKLGNDKEE